MTALGRLLPLLTAFGAVLLGGGLATALGVAVVSPAGWACLATGALVAGAAAAAAPLRKPAAPPAASPAGLPATPPPATPPPAAAGPQAASEPREAQRKLRHDLRGALSPALLTADRLLTHADPSVQRAGDIMVRAVEKAAALLADPPEPTATPPARR